MQLMTRVKVLYQYVHTWYTYMKVYMYTGYEYVNIFICIGVLYCNRI